PLPIQPVADAPGFVSGVAVVRGVPQAVVDAGKLLGTAGSHATRFVTLRIGDRRVTLAVDAVLGMRRISPADQSPLPPLLQGTNADVIAALGTLGAELLVVLQSARSLSDSAWMSLAEGAVPR